jgi:hypothetical protein
MLFRQGDIYIEQYAASRGAYNSAPCCRWRNDGPSASDSRFSNGERWIWFRDVIDVDADCMRSCTGAPDD